MCILTAPGAQTIMNFFSLISNVWSPLFDLMNREAYLLIADTMAALSCEAACQIAGRTDRGITVF